MTISVKVNTAYRAANGTRIGPLWRDCGGFIQKNGDGFVWEDDGRLRCAPDGVGKDGWDLVAEWVKFTPCLLESTVMTKAVLLDAAKAAVADRGLNYGRPEDNFRRIAGLWNAHLANRVDEDGKTTDAPRLTAADVAQMMVLMKVARLQNQPAHLDSWTDIAGYAACGAEITSRIENSA